MNDLPTIFVPVVFTEEQARHLCGAARSTIQACAVMGRGADIGPLAQAMIELAEATDRACEKAAA